MSDKDNDSKDEAKPEAPKNRLVIILVVVNLVVVLAAAGGVVAFTVMGGASPAPAAAAEPAPGAMRDIGPLMEVADMVVNLSDETGTRYMRAGFQFELADADRQSDVEARMVPVRSAILLHLSGLDAEGTRGRENREALLEALRDLVNEQLGGEHVRAVYFTTFVVQ